MLNIALIFGGKSVEHDISIITAMQVIKGLKNFNVIPVYVLPDGRFVTGNKLKNSHTFLNFNLKKCNFISFEMGTQNLMIFSKNKIKRKIKIDCALLCGHGHGCEDGSMQGMLELAQIPYTSSNVPSSAITMDKVLTKIILKDAKISTPAYVYFDKWQYKHDKIELLHKVKTELKFPCIVKPASLGSSVGVNICENEAKIEEVVDEAFLYDNKVIIEKFVPDAREFACAVIKIGEKLLTSQVIEVNKKAMYTFDDKYILNQQTYPKEIAKNLEERIKRQCIKAYRALSCDGIVRIDFLYNQKQNKLYVNELNAIPGSLSCNMFQTSLDDLLSTLIQQGIEKNRSKSEIVYKFNSDAIKKFIELEDHLKYKH